MIHSPNTVLAKYLKDVADVIRPRIEMRRPKEIQFYVGTNVNGAPHIGTYLTHTLAFMYAKRVRERFNIPVRIVFGIHDNISYSSKEDERGRVFHQTYFHALGDGEIKKLIREYYSGYFDELSAKTDVTYSITTYSDSQKSESFRTHFISSLTKAERIRWCVAPSSGFLQVRIPCPTCNYSERDAAQTSLLELDGESARFSSHCLAHGVYESLITAQNSTYIDLNTLYRNVIKEYILAEDTDILHVVIKGGDWVYGTTTLDWALGELGYTSVQLPIRFFLPQVVTHTGAKLSKSLIMDKHESVKEIPPWMVDMQTFKSSYPDYLARLLKFSDEVLSDPRHVFRSYSQDEISRLLGL